MNELDNESGLVYNHSKGWAETLIPAKGPSQGDPNKRVRSLNAANPLLGE